MLVKQKKLFERKQAFNKKKQGGFDLIQIGIVVAIIGVLMASATVGVPKIMASIRDNGEISDMNIIGINLLNKYANTTIPNTQEPLTGAIQNEIFPPNKKAGTAFANRYGGVMTMAASNPNTTGLPPRGITITSANIPSTACEKIVKAVQHHFVAIRVGNGMVKNNGRDLIEADLSQRCGAGASLADLSKGIAEAEASQPVTIEFTYG